MTATDLALVVATTLCAIGFAALVVVLMRVLQSLHEVRGALVDIDRAVHDLAATSQPLLEEMRDSVDEARDDLDRFDRVIGSAEAISTRLQGTSRLTRAAFSTPVIKTVALASGTRRTARELRAGDPLRDDGRGHTKRGKGKGR